MAESKGKVLSFEEAINETGFGLYSYLMVGMAGSVIISLACVVYGNTIIIPTSACELDTTVGQRGLLAAMPLVGMIIGAVFWGYLSDKFGRKPILLISLLSAATVNGIASISVNWIMLLCMQFLTAILAAGQYALVMTLASETVPSAKRNTVLLWIASIFLLSQAVKSVLAIPIIPLSFSIYLPGLDIYWNSWRTVMAVYSLPSILTATWLFFMYESPKFLYAKGREIEALAVLQKIHSLNVKGKRFEIEGLLPDVQQPTHGGDSSKSKLGEIFSTPLLKSTLLLTLLNVFQQVGAFMVWLPTIANHFSLSIETGQTAGLTLCDIIRASLDSPSDLENETPCALNITALLFTMIACSIQSASNWGLSSIVNKVGRRNMVMLVSSICGFSGILINLVPNAIGSAVMFCIFLIGIVVMGLYTAITVATFPTHLRATAIALTTTGSRLGTAAATQILNVLLESNCEAGFYLFTAIFTSSAIIAFFLTDDRIAKNDSTPSEKLS